MNFDSTAKPELDSTGAYVSGDAAPNSRGVISELRHCFDAQIFSAYIEPLQLVAFDLSSGTVELAAPSKFHLNYIRASLIDRLTDGLRQALKVPEVKLTLVVSAESGRRQQSSAVRPHVIVKKVPLVPANSRDNLKSEGGTGLNPRYTFDSFVVGSSNEFCYAAARRVAETPGKSYNPLFIYGGVGLGKTHLMHAIGNEAQRLSPGLRVLYISSETFTNELILALRNERMDEFKRKFRGINLLLIDDIQFMAGKERTLEEFFHTFNHLYSAKQQIVITSDKAPNQIHGLEERLKTRFSWGLMADLQSPDFETRVAILKRKAASESMALPEDVAQLISEKISSNVRELEGALTRLFAISSLKNSAIDVELARAALRPLLKERRGSLSIDDIKKGVSTHFSLKVSELCSKRRTRTIAWPRQVAMYLCRKHTSTSYPEIGNQFGGRDHSSVIHSANVVSMKIASDPETKRLVEEIERELLGED